jgi:hypothetical protein
MTFMIEYTYTRDLLIKWFSSIKYNYEYDKMPPKQL